MIIDIRDMLCALDVASFGGAHPVTLYRAEDGIVVYTAKFTPQRAFVRVRFEGAMDNMVDPVTLDASRVKWLIDTFRFSKGSCEVTKADTHLIVKIDDIVGYVKYLSGASVMPPIVTDVAGMLIDVELIPLLRLAKARKIDTAGGVRVARLADTGHTEISAIALQSSTTLRATGVVSASDAMAYTHQTCTRHAQAFLTMVTVAKWARPELERMSAVVGSDVVHINRGYLIDVYLFGVALSEEQLNIDTYMRERMSAMPVFGRALMRPDTYMMLADVIADHPICSVFLVAKNGELSCMVSMCQMNGHVGDVAVSRRIGAWEGDDMVVSVSNPHVLFSTAFDDYVPVPHTLTILTDEKRRPCYVTVVDDSSSRWMWRTTSTVASCSTT